MELGGLFAIIAHQKVRQDTLQQQQVMNKVSYVPEKC